MRYVIDARYVRARPSGIGAYVEALIERLPALAPGASFRLWTHPERPEPVVADNVTHQVVHATADGFRTMFMPARLDALAPDDVVHFPFSILGRGVRCATIVTVHDLMWLERPELVDAVAPVRRVRQVYYQAGMRRALREATQLIAVSRATADRILDHVPDAAKRLVVTYNAAHSAFSPPSDAAASRRRAEELVGAGAPYYVVVGKNEPYKAHPVAIRAFAAGARRHDRLVIVQREHAGRGLSQLVRELGLTRRVVWVPELSREQLVDVLRNARALLQPSVIEGFGMPVLEAMACGCPVVASDTPALVEVLDGAGLHGGVGDVDSLAEAIRRLRDESLWRDLRARGLERARSFDWDDTARATLEIYRDVACRAAKTAS